MAMLDGILRNSEEESWDEGSTEKKSIWINFMNGEEWHCLCGSQTGPDTNMKVSSQTTELNVAYEALETMHKANLEVEFS
eukprot:897454-Ditylum_brightwellii.AAC.1